MYQIGIESYCDPSSRPRVFRDECFYLDPVEPHFDEGLETTADNASELLVTQGFAVSQAQRRVAHSIYAAATISQGCSTQAELQARIGAINSTWLIETMSPAAAMSLTPFLANVTDFEFNMDNWLTKLSDVAGDWERIRPTLRWLDLWKDQVSEGTAEQVIEKVVALEELNGTQELAHYADRIIDIFSDRPEVAQRMLAGIPRGQRLPLFSYLGDASEYVKGIMDKPFGADLIAASGLVKTVKHVSNFAGNCSHLDTGHARTMGESEAEGELVLVYGAGQLLGSIKMIRERSLLSYVTIKDGSKYPLVKGAAYVPDRTTVDLAEDAFIEQGNWAKIHIDGMEVRPIRFTECDVYDDPDRALRFFPIIEKAKEKLASLSLY